MPWPKGATFKVLDMLSSRCLLKLENMCWPLISASQDKLNARPGSWPESGVTNNQDRRSENWENRPYITWSPEKNTRVRVYLLRITHNMGANETQSLGSKAEVSFPNLKVKYKLQHKNQPCSHQRCRSERAENPTCMDKGLRWGSTEIQAGPKIRVWNRAVIFQHSFF